MIDKSIKSIAMKKNNSSASPFLILIIPILLFIGLSLAIKESDSEDLNANFLMRRSATATMVEVGQQSIIRFLLKDNL